MTDLPPPRNVGRRAEDHANAQPCDGCANEVHALREELKTWFPESNPDTHKAFHEKLIADALLWQGRKEKAILGLVGAAATIAGGYVIELVKLSMRQL
jgi:hypothetical protein